MRLSRRAPFFDYRLAVLGLVGALLIVTAGCSTVYVSGATPSTSRNFGLVSVQIPNVTAEPVLVATEGFGLTLGSQSATLGWLRELVIVVPDAAKCRVFMIVQTDEELRSLKDTFMHDSKAFENICIFSKEGGKWTH